MEWRTEFGRQPSKVLDEPWLSIDNGQSRTDRVGKWMVFCRMGDDLDKTWLWVMAGVMAGKLGPSAKVATAADARGWGSPIMVYTRDADDLVDVERVLGTLRDLRIRRRLTYKEDRATYAGQYGRGSGRYHAAEDSRHAVQSASQSVGLEHQPELF